ncbi:MAG: stage sporulation protein [Moorella sp. (in: firmicutes)]|nr:stage sporulation protein [Moorella sp. (in: firmicutes)]
MIKLLGGVLIITTSGYLGLMVARGYRARIEQLRHLNTGLKMLETEIKYTATPLPLALIRVGNQLPGVIAHFFHTVAGVLKADAAAGALAAWERGLEELRARGALEAEDLEILRALGPMLGRSGVSDQVKNLEMTRQLLGQQQLAALESNNRQGRMWQTLGFLLGITLVLLLY